MADKPKILDLDGFRYSRDEFEGYKFRALAEFNTDNGFHSLSIYTTNPSRSETEKFLRSRTSEKAEFQSIVNWCTKELDDLATELINEWLDEN